MTEKKRTTTRRRRMTKMRTTRFWTSSYTRHDLKSAPELVVNYILASLSYLPYVPYIHFFGS